VRAVAQREDCRSACNARASRRWHTFKGNDFGGFCKNPLLRKVAQVFSKSRVCIKDERNERQADQLLIMRLVSSMRGTPNQFAKRSDFTGCF
jgi:hypothetical protein